MCDPRVVEPEQINRVTLRIIRKRARGGRRDLHLLIGVLRDHSTYVGTLRRELSEPPNRIHASMTPDTVRALVLLPCAHAKKRERDYERDGDSVW